MGNDKLTIIQPGILQGLSGLGYLILEGNQLSRVSYIDYKQLIGLYDLNLDYNQIASIEIVSFLAMNYLKLHPSTNQLTVIIFAMFHGLTDLSVLIIRSLQQPGVFGDLPVLAFVNLTNNELTGINVNELPFYHCINIQLK